MKTIVVVDYDPGWVTLFEQLRAQIMPAVHDVATTVEHVGSTSVPGLAAKPIVDISVVVPTEADVPVAIARLATLGYAHLGNLGVEGREAFSTPGHAPPHHLYVCPRNSLALANHLAVRDHLRAHPNVAHDYGELKKQLARQFTHDIDGYTEGKTEAILRILEMAGFQASELKMIERINRRAV
jgi:GrpB-like predicted nucleotidyltransferase (UPF0157 family)